MPIGIPTINKRREMVRKGNILKRRAGGGCIRERGKDFQYDRRPAIGFNFLRRRRARDPLSESEHHHNDKGGTRGAGLLHNMCRF